MVTHQLGSAHGRRRASLGLMSVGSRPPQVCPGIAAPEIIAERQRHRQRAVSCHTRAVQTAGMAERSTFIEASADEKTRSQAVIVVGMHRSGTSAITRVLNLRGLDLPKALLPPRDDNPLGYWEPRDVVEAHDRFLAAIGSAYDDVLALPPEALWSHAGQELADELVEILRREFSESSAFVVKDPRISRLMPLWLRVLERVGADPKFVVWIRNPLEVADSLRARNEFEETKSLLLWLRHVLGGEFHTRGHLRTVVSYEDLLEDWRGVIHKIAADLALAWPHASAATEAAIDSFLSPSRRHHAADSRDVEGRDDITAWVKETYAVMLAAARGDDLDIDTLDRIHGEVERADLTYGPLLADASARVTESTATVGRLAADVVERDDRLADCEHELQSLRLEVDSATEALAEHENALSELQARREQELAEAQRTSEALRRDLDARTHDLAVAAVRLEGAEALLVERDALLAARDETIDGLHRAAEAAAVAKAEPEPPPEVPFQASPSLPPARPRPLRRWPHLAAQVLFQPRRVLREAVAFRELRDSPLFDREFYLARYPDVALAGMDPLKHYIRHGAADGQDPSAAFDTRRYLAEHPGLLESGVNPLLHFVKQGDGAAHAEPPVIARSEAAVIGPPAPPPEGREVARAVPTGRVDPRRRDGTSRSSGRRPIIDFSDVLVVLGRQRSGTTALRSILDTHPDVFVIGEVFNIADRDAREELVREANFFNFAPRHAERHPEVLLPGQHEELFVDYFEYLRGFSPSRYFAVDVKYNMTQFFAKPWATDVMPFFYELVVRHDVKVLRVTRRNYLRYLLSAEKAWRSDRYGSLRDDDYADTKIALDVDTVIAVLESCATEDELVGRALSTYPNVRSYDYVEIFPRPNEVSDEVLEDIRAWLELDDAFSRDSPWRKQSSLPLAETIENFGEVEAALRGTRFERCLDDEPAYLSPPETAAARIPRKRMVAKPATQPSVRSKPLPPEHTRIVHELWNTRPGWIEGSLPLADTEYLFATVYEAGVDRVVELGTASGFSTAVICRALGCAQESAMIDGDFHVVSYDIDDRLYFDRSRLVGDAAREILSPDLLAHMSFRAPATALSFNDDFDEDEIEVMFLDANHSHPWPALDLLAALDFLRPGATVILHDINLPRLSADFPNWGVTYLFEALAIDKEVPPGELPNIGRITIPRDKDALRGQLYEIVSAHSWEASIPDAVTHALLE